MVRDEDVRSARTDATRPLHEEPRVAESEGGDEYHLERAGDVLLRALAEETGHPLRDVEHEEYPRKDGEEDERAQPGPHETPLPGNRPRSAGAVIGVLLSVDHPGPDPRDHLRNRLVDRQSDWGRLDIGQATAPVAQPSTSTPKISSSTASARCSRACRSAHLSSAGCRTRS